jgi:hypothetical protein
MEKGEGETIMGLAKDAVLTEAEASRLMSRGKPILCERCVEKSVEKALIQIGEAFVRKRRHNRHGQETVYYHKKCWDSYFREVT